MMNPTHASALVDLENGRNSLSMTLLYDTSDWTYYQDPLWQMVRLIQEELRCSMLAIYPFFVKDRLWSSQGETISPTDASLIDFYGRFCLFKNAFWSVSQYYTLYQLQPVQNLSKMNTVSWGLGSLFGDVDVEQERCAIKGSVCFSYLW